MLINVTEIILIVLIVAIVFGAGRLPSIASAVGKMRMNFRRGLQEGEPIDITPVVEPGESSGDAARSRKPGHFDQEVEDAVIDPE
ncbi:MAG: twin-arginine translocase TatA/TatE family subunit [Myxococcota bacterium]